jgi:hypothetical protein
MLSTTFHEHILTLEQKMQALSDQLTKQGVSSAERERVMKKVGIAGKALGEYRRAFEHYQNAIEFEQELNAEKPN